MTSRCFWWSVAALLCCAAALGAYSVVECVRLTNLLPQAPPEGTVVGESVRRVRSLMNAQFPHNPIDIAIFSRVPNRTVVVPEVQQFFNAFNNAASASFFGPHITLMMSPWTVPLLTLDWVAGGDNLDTVAIRVDNNMSSTEQRRVTHWVRTFVDEYSKSNSNFTAICTATVTGIGAMDEALRSELLYRLLIVVLIGTVLACLCGPVIIAVSQVKFALTSMKEVASQGASRHGYSSPVVSPRSSSSGAGAYGFAGSLPDSSVAIFSFTRVVVAGSAYLVLVTFTCVSISLGCGMLYARWVHTTTWAVVGTSLLLTPFTTLLGNAVLHSFVLLATQRPELQFEASIRRQDSPSFAPHANLGASLLPREAENITPSDAGGSDVFGADLRRCRRIFNQTWAPALITVYAATLLFTGGLWLVGVKRLSSSGAVSFIATAVHLVVFITAAPLGAALAFPGRAACYEVRDLTIGALLLEDGADRPAALRLARFVLERLKPSEPIRLSHKSVIMRAVVAALAVGFTSWAAATAKGSIAFYPRLPRDSETVVAGKRLVAALDAPKMFPYVLVFQAHAPGGINRNSFLAAANDATFNAAESLGFSEYGVLSITSVANLQNFTTTTAVWLNLLPGINPTYSYIWDLTVDPTSTIFGAYLTPTFDPMADDGRATAAQQQLDLIVANLASRYPDEFAFVGWYGGNALPWSEKNAALASVTLWTFIALGLATIFGAFVWYRHGKFAFSMLRYREMIGADARLSSRSRSVSCSTVREVLLSVGHSLGVCLSAMLDTALGFSVAIGVFQHSGLLERVWQSLADVSGVSWDVFLLFLPAMLTLAYAHETFEWFAEHERSVERHATHDFATAREPIPERDVQRTQQRHSRRRSSTRNSAQTAMTDDPDEALVEDLSLPPGVTGAVAAHLCCWSVSFGTMTLSSAPIVNEIGVAFAGCVAAHALVAVTFATLTYAFLDRFRVTN